MKAYLFWCAAPWHFGRIIMNDFARYHPFVIVLYFVGTLVWNLLLFDPIVLVISLTCQIFFYLDCYGRDGLFFVLGCLAAACLCGVVNLFVNHRGMSVIFFLMGLPVTAESLLFGLKMGILLAMSLLLFGCFHRIMTSEKLMSFMGNAMPGFALVFSMALRLVPKLKRDYRKLCGNHGLKWGTLSTLFGLAVEESLETGQAMSDRGYGSGTRTNIYAVRFRAGDLIFAVVFTLLFTASVGLYFSSGTRFDFFPCVEFVVGKGGRIAYLCALAGVFMPLVLNLKEELRWRHIISRI